MVRELLECLGRLLTWFIVVAPWEQAIRIRMGKHVTLLGSGCHVLIPFVDRAYRQATRRRLTIIGPLTLTTQDNRTIIISGYVGYCIKDMVKLYDSISQATDTIDCETMSHISHYVSTHTLENCHPKQIEEAVLEKLARLHEYGLGEVEFFISNFATTKTYRFITGEIRAWMHEGNHLSTDVR